MSAFNALIKIRGSKENCEIEGEDTGNERIATALGHHFINGDLTLVDHSRAGRPPVCFKSTQYQYSLIIRVLWNFEQKVQIRAKNWMVVVELPHLEFSPELVPFATKRERKRLSTAYGLNTKINSFSGPDPVQPFRYNRRTGSDRWGAAGRGRARVQPAEGPRREEQKAARN
ncbi:hypothetical protein EVAR_36879_1 [Eumeta japonica]|uniref:Uncharacterized protein n=1 Tax=Eumeta variegata TaxID=151549 RepID=A0A4C1WR72_EUMVA|nr:hypothetical protein EVAR_36879_1 [Eumeta japonica]